MNLLFRFTCSWFNVLGMCFSSGLGATTSIVHMLKAGDHIVSIDDVYGGTNRYFSKVATKFGLELTFCDMTADPENLREAMTPATKVGIHKFFTNIRP